jgi:hypothetical protein
MRLATCHHEGVRLLLFPVVAASCATPPIKLFVNPADGYELGGDLDAPTTLGVGLVQTYDVAEDVGDDQCVYVLCPDDPTPRTWAIKVTAGSAVEVGSIQPVLSVDGSPTGNASFMVEGVAEGEATVEISANGVATTDIGITVHSIGSGGLLARVPEAANAFPNVDNIDAPFVAFTAGSDAQFFLSTKFFDDSGAQLAGGARISITTADPGIVATVVLDTGVLASSSECDCRLTECNCGIAPGATVGSAEITAAGTSSELDVVDATAIADITLYPAPPIALAPGGEMKYFVLPIDAAQQLIMGSGAALQAAVSDPSVASVELGGTMYDRSVTVMAAQAGSATLDLTWGSVERSFAVTVSSAGSGG